MQILADTCIWVGHLRASNSLLQTFLEDGVVLMHPSVRCELALGSLNNRAEILGAFASFQKPKLPPMTKYSTSLKLGNFGDSVLAGLMPNCWRPRASPPLATFGLLTSGFAQPVKNRASSSSVARLSASSAGRSLVPQTLSSPPSLFQSPPAQS